MRRFLIFGGPHYYPSGGWSDFLGDAPSLEQAKVIADHVTNDPAGIEEIQWAQIVDTESWEVLVWHERIGLWEKAKFSLGDRQWVRDA